MAHTLGGVSAAAATETWEKCVESPWKLKLREYRDRLGHEWQSQLALASPPHVLVTLLVLRVWI